MLEPAISIPPRFKGAKLVVVAIIARTRHLKKFVKILRRRFKSLGQGHRFLILHYQSGPDTMAPVAGLPSFAELEDSPEFFPDRPIGQLAIDCHDLSSVSDKLVKEIIILDDVGWPLFELRLVVMARGLNVEVVELFREPAARCSKPKNKVQPQASAKLHSKASGTGPREKTCKQSIAQARPQSWEQARAQDAARAQLRVLEWRRERGETPAKTSPRHRSVAKNSPILPPVKPIWTVSGPSRVDSKSLPSRAAKKRKKSPAKRTPARPSTPRTPADCVEYYDMDGWLTSEQAREYCERAHVFGVKRRSLLLQMRIVETYFAHARYGDGDVHYQNILNAPRVLQMLEEDQRINFLKFINEIDGIGVGDDDGVQLDPKLLARRWPVFLYHEIVCVSSLRNREIAHIESITSPIYQPGREALRLQPVPDELRRFGARMDTCRVVKAATRYPRHHALELMLARG